MSIENAIINVDYNTDDLYIYQTIRITPSKKSHTRYFFMEKYKAARELNMFLRKIYLGDGENIFFVDKQKFRSQILLKYRVEKKIELDLSSKKYYIQVNIPKYDGCNYCTWLMPTAVGQNRCGYYKEFLSKLKIFCSDFEEKD